MRYIDDLIVLNDNGYFNSIIEKIYPRQLELNATASSTQHSTYLDMYINISIVDDKFVQKIYDKRNDFCFNVISLPNLSSIVPIKPTYGVFYSQLVRIFNVNNNVSDFVDCVKTLMKKLHHQN